MKRNLSSTFSSRMMRWGGLTILLFLVWCTAACPKEVPLDVISRLNADLFAAMRHGH